MLEHEDERLLGLHLLQFAEVKIKHTFELGRTVPLPLPLRLSTIIFGT